MMDYSYRYIDYVTVLAFVKRWHLETNAFYLHFGDITITLDDVKQILEVQVVGKVFYE